MRLDNPSDTLYKHVKVVAFTGTQVGMSGPQKKAFRGLLLEIKPEVLIHGDCIGADAEAHDIAEELGLEIWIRPCTIEYKRAFKSGKLLAEPEDPIARNHKMVDQSQALIGCPKQNKSTLRSGTWATVRYARKVELLRWLVYRDGSILTPFDTL